MSTRSRIVTFLLVALAAVALIATNSRFTILDDESTIVAVAGHPLLPTLRLFLQGGSNNEHPPFSDMVLHLWLLATRFSLPLLRVFANLFYLAGSVFLALAAQRAGGKRAYWAALLLTLVWPFSFQYGRITGWYCFCWFLIALLTWIYLRILAGGGGGDWTAFGIIAAILVWSNYFGVAVLLLLLADLLVAHLELASRRIRPLMAVIVAVAAIYLPLLKVTLQKAAEQAAPVALHLALKNMVAQAGYALFSIFASSAVAPWYLPLSVPAFLATAVLLISIWRSAERRWLVYWVLAIVILGLSGYMNIKRMVFLLPWLFLAMALAAANENFQRAAPALTACVVLVVVGWAGILSGRHYSTTNLYEPWEQVARTVALDARNGAAILSENPPFFFYLNYQLGLEKDTQAAQWAYLGEHVYSSHGYKVLSPEELPQSSESWRGKVVLVNGSAPMKDVQAIEALDSQLRSRCAVLGEYRAAPDPAATLKRRFATDAAALTYRTDVVWFDCP